MQPTAYRSAGPYIMFALGNSNNSNNMKFDSKPVAGDAHNIHQKMQPGYSKPITMESKSLCYLASAQGVGYIYCF